MVHVIIKDDDRKQREEQILKEFGCNPNSATKEDREKAEYIAEKVNELKKNWRD